jgi:hypothetical protein
LDVINGPIAAFAQDLRTLRKRAGNPSYRELASTALFAPSVLSTAASGHRMPTLSVTLAFVAACGGDEAAWERRWRSITGRTATESREDRTSDAVPDTPQPAAEPLTHPAQLPMGSSTFVGRVRVLTDTARLIGSSGPARRPLLVSGPIGSGKAAFALRLAEELATYFPDGQLYADLANYGTGNQSANSIVRGFLHALGAPAHVVGDDPMHQIGLYRSLLAQRRLFVLLTNVRDESQVRSLLGQAAHSQVVMTSRTRLLGLDDTRRIDLEPFSREESIMLLGRLAGAARVRAELRAADAIADLCADLPLAVNIIGRKIAARPEWAFAHTAELLTDHHRLLDCLSIGDVNVRDRFVSAHQLLSPAARQALHHLAHAGVAWTTAVGVAATMDVSVDTADELLESLVDTGLLTRSGAAGRYRMSRLVSVFAMDAQRDAIQMTVPLVDRRMQLAVVEQPQRDAARV